MLSELENIDDDCDQHNIAFVKISDLEEAKEYGIDSLPTLVFFERRIPHVYDGQYPSKDFRFYTIKYDIYEERT